MSNLADFFVCSIFSLILLSCFAYGQGNEQASLADDAAYKAMRPCAEGCLGGIGGYSNICGLLDCQNGCLNSCYCGYGRTDLQSSATSFLVSCVSSYCTQGDPGPDATSASSAYLSYCLKNGFSLPGATAAATTAASMPASTITGNPNAPTATQVTTVTVSSKAGSNMLSSSLLQSESAQLTWFLVFAVVGPMLFVCLFILFIPGATMIGESKMFTKITYSNTIDTGYHTLKYNC